MNASTDRISRTQPPPLTFRQAARPAMHKSRATAQPRDTLTIEKSAQTTVHFGQTELGTEGQQSNQFRDWRGQAWHGFRKTSLKGLSLLEEAVNKLTEIGCRMALLSTFIMPMPRSLYNFIERQTFYAPVRSCSEEFIKNEDLRKKLRPQIINIPDEKGRNLPMWAWRIKTKEEMPTVVFSHGRNTNISHYEKHLQALTDQGFNVLIYDYAGFGNSKGKVSKENCYKAGIGAINHLMEEQVPLEKQILMGYSLGTHITAHMAETVTQNPEAFGGKKPAGVVLLNSFPNLEKAFQHKLHVSIEDKPYVPKRFLKRIFTPNENQLKLNTEEKLETTLKNAPDLNMLILHGKNDREVSPVDAEEMAKKLGKSVEFHTLEEAGHTLNAEQCKKVAVMMAKRFIRA